VVRAIAIATTVLLLATLHLLRLRGCADATPRSSCSSGNDRSARARQPEPARARGGVGGTAPADQPSRIGRGRGAQPDLRELHDEFGQTLTAAKINLQMLRSKATDPAVVQRLDDSVGMVDRMIRRPRHSQGPAAAAAGRAGLVPALEDHLKALSKRSDTRIEFEADPGVANAPKGLNTAVFRVIQEAVSNALRHAQASTIRVVLRDEPDALRVEIEDDASASTPRSSSGASAAASTSGCSA